MTVNWDFHMAKKPLGSPIHDRERGFRLNHSLVRYEARREILTFHWAQGFFSRPLNDQKIHSKLFKSGHWSLFLEQLNQLAWLIDLCSQRIMKLGRKKYNPDFFFSLNPVHTQKALTKKKKSTSLRLISSS